MLTATVRTTHRRAASWHRIARVSGFTVQAPCQVWCTEKSIA